jgi:HAD superfamily hydrolase (TIGR01509 family)
MINEIGFSISLKESADRFTGISLPASIKIVEETLGRKLPESFASDYETHTFEIFHRELKAVNGVRDLLMRLPNPTCVASSGDHKKIKTNLTITGLYSNFEGRIYSAHDVERGKPFPDLFLHAASSMGYEPSQCVVIEDSVPGVQAGKAAGMKVFGYSERTSDEELAQAGAITFSHMSELLNLIQKF